MWLRETQKVPLQRQRQHSSSYLSGHGDTHLSSQNWEAEVKSGMGSQHGQPSEKRAHLCKRLKSRSGLPQFL